MRKTISTGLAVLLLAGAAGSALAQDRGDRQGRANGRGLVVEERGERGDRGNRPDRGDRGDRSERRDRGDRGDRGGERRERPDRAQEAQPAPSAPVAPRAREDRRQNGRGLIVQDRDQSPRGDQRGRDGRDWNNDRRGDNNDRRDWNRRDNDGRSDRRDWDRDGRRWQHQRPVYRSPQRYQFRGRAYRPPVGFYSRSWGYGDFLPRGWYGADYRILDWMYYGLPAPPPGCDWVRVGYDAILIDRFTGEVLEVVSLIFW